MHVSVLVSIGCVALALVSMTCGAAKAEDDGFCPEPDFGIWRMLGETTFANRGVVISGMRAGPMFMKVHLYRLSFQSDAPERPLSNAAGHGYRTHIRCLEGDVFPLLGYLYRAVWTDEPGGGYDGTPLLVRAERIEREATPDEFLPTRDRYIATATEERIPSGWSQSELHGEAFRVSDLRFAAQGEPVARLEFGERRRAGIWDFGIHPAREVRQGDVVRFGEFTHRVTRIFPSRENVTIDGKESYLLGWIEFDPVPVEEAVPEAAIH